MTTPLNNGGLAETTVAVRESLTACAGSHFRVTQGMRRGLASFTDCLQRA